MSKQLCILPKKKGGERAPKGILSTHTCGKGHRLHDRLNKNKIQITFQNAS